MKKKKMARRISVEFEIFAYFVLVVGDDDLSEEATLGNAFDEVFQRVDPVPGDPVGRSFEKLEPIGRKVRCEDGS